ncbi:MAG: protein-L-isoaspartate(D-aspartate) O-methyltransferase [Proteobacteria bacterium]|nr:protein-L-isoaspartate(D-aspartate) O-methyltransferase [Pseudomonadota bacterium]MBU1641443.1 protein-L-isoaspartate(D-aspartate) O-methyltransferase [Pseudomonadota bacterium]
MNFESARMRMLREQLIPRGITDQRVLDAMSDVPRHLFVQDALRSQAYGDFSMPIGLGQTISQPYIVALMTQALELKREETVLEIGTGCGYQTAVLAKLAERVFSIERLKELHIRARQTLDQLQVLNAICTTDDGTLGWPQYSPFDAIIVTAGGPDIPKALIDQLADPGRLVIPIGDRETQELVVLKKENGEISRHVIEQVRFVSLIGSQGWHQ